jgi:hypothetical protein
MPPQIEELLVETSERQRGRFYGKYRGTVKEVLEGDDLGKIVVSVPEVYEDENSPAATPCVPFAGPGHGLLVLPEVDDGVWVEFEQGNPSYPIWTGAWWASGDIPDPKGPKVRALVTTGNLKLVLDDDGKKLQLLHPSGGEITMSDSGIVIKFNSTQIELSSQGVSVNNGAFQVL